jgi:shikimate dehydrogenase
MSASDHDDVPGDRHLIVTGGFATRGRYAVIGHPVDHSRSPELHNPWFDAARLPGRYEKLDIAPDELVRRGPSLPYEFAGLNVTIPHKVAILGYVDQVDDAARAAGAANVLYRDKTGAWTAGNTDGAGFVRSIEDATGETVMGMDVVVLGAGGAARAVAAELARIGVASLAVAARRKEQAEELLATVGGTMALELGPEFLQSHPVSVDLVVNTLPATAETFVGALDLAPLPGHAILADINYHVERPVLLRKAEAMGLLGVDGRGMFLWQGALSFELWTGRAPDLAIGRRVLGMEGW